MTWPACMSAALIVCATWPAAAQVADESAVPRISVVELKQAIDARQVLVVDVRDPRSYADGHLPGAINIPLDELARKPALLKSAKTPIVAYCA